MTLEALAAPTFDIADSIFDFARPAAAAAAPSAAALAAARTEPEAGWASANPERAMLYLFVTPCDGIVADELLAR
jgi:hypothetical protein